MARARAGGRARREARAGRVNFMLMVLRVVNSVKMGDSGVQREEVV